MTGDIESSVVKTINNRDVGVHGVSIKLLRPDNSLASKTTSEFDGYYSFLSVAIGSYRIVFVDSQTQSILAEQNIVLDAEHNFIEVDKTVLP